MRGSPALGRASSSCCGPSIRPRKASAKSSGGLRNRISSERARRSTTSGSSPASRSGRASGKSSRNPEAAAAAAGHQALPRSPSRPAAPVPAPPAAAPPGRTLCRPLISSAESLTREPSRYSPRRLSTGSPSCCRSWMQCPASAFSRLIRRFRAAQISSRVPCARPQTAARAVPSA